tara:strand:+ start:17797 stop:19374 length:1578 start_codon:yes stop_codon:yes gene_type:complete
MNARLFLAVSLLIPVFSLAQVPVDEDGNVIGQYEPSADIALLSAAELEELVGPIALYPDDLLAIVLPASAYPLQVVEAARFLEAYEIDSSLEPNEDWDDSIVALINYPEVVELLNEDLDWTLRLGDAMAAQQSDVVAAVEAFRDRAYAAGNLKSDEYQTVAENDGVIYIEPAEEDVIYVPYYEPTRVVYVQPDPVYFYYPRPRPVYYYPYAANYHFAHNHFWGVTTAFTIGWASHSLHTYHHSYYGHPYYGRSYWHHWYRRPSITVYNNYYSHSYRNGGHHYRNGDRWRAQDRRREYVRREGYARTDRQGNRRTLSVNRTNRQVAFRPRDERITPRAPATRSSQSRQQPAARTSENRRQDGARQNNNARTQQPAVRSNVRRSEDLAVRSNARRNSSEPVVRSQTQRRSSSLSTGSHARRDQPQSVVRSQTQRRSSSLSTGSNARREQAQPVVRSQTQRRQEPVRQQRSSTPVARQQRQAPVAQQRQAPQRQQASRSVQKQPQVRSNSGRKSSERRSDSRSGSRRK